jgi:hypothetical protein
LLNRHIALEAKCRLLAGRLHELGQDV